jgi:ABC-type multidrug transport system ATPase subunit
LLALAGRMRFSSGRARVSGFVLPRERRDAQRVVALGLMKGVNDFDETTAVGDLLRAAGPGRARPLNARPVAAAMDVTELTLGSRRLVRDLSADERVRLGIALALLDDPEVIVVDDVDDGLSPERAEAVWRVMRRVTGRGVTVVASCVGSAVTARQPALVVTPRPVPPAADTESELTDVRV